MQIGRRTSGCLLFLWLLAGPPLAWSEPSHLQLRVVSTPAVEKITVGSDTAQANPEGLFEFPLEDFAQSPTVNFYGHGYTASQVLSPQSLGESLGITGLTSKELGSLLGGRTVDIRVEMHPQQTLPWRWLLALPLAGALAWGLKKRKGGAAPEITDPFVGASVGKYRVLEQLGSGGMATVYRAEPGVAIKVLKPELKRAKNLDQFEREIRVTMGLNHPNIVQVVDWHRHNGLDCLVMELLSGKTLSSLIPKEGLDVKTALGYYLPLLDALVYAHGRGVAHGDLKPENAMLAPNGQLKWVDFGLASCPQKRPGISWAHHGDLMGTPEYMAPERIRAGAGPVSPQSDQYSMGIVLYEMLSGRVPFGGDALEGHLHQSPPALAKPVPSPLEAALRKTLEKNPRARFTSVKDFQGTLLQIVNIR